MGYILYSFVLLVINSVTFDVTDSRNSCKCTCSHSSIANVLSRTSDAQVKASPEPDPCASAKPTPQARVYEGRAALERERPFQVHLYLVQQDKLSGRCGGSIYNSNTVLTAAHCLFGLQSKPESIVTRVGYLRYSPDPSRGQWMVATELLLHPGYDRSSYNRGSDLALIRLNGSYTYNNVVQPIGLIDPSAELVGKSVLVSGWGQTSLGSGPLKYPKALQLVDLTIISTQSCAQEFATGKNFSYSEDYFDTKFCASGITSTRSGCPGDSGGPLTCEVETPEGSVTKLCGVVKGGFGCGCGLPDVYTDMTDPKMYQWIRENAGMPDTPTLRY